MNQTTEKNPYRSDTPEWQLFENMVSSEQYAAACAVDSARALEKAAAAREKAAAYKEALAKLSAP